MGSRPVQAGFQSLLGDFSKSKGASRHHFRVPLPNLRATCRRQGCIDTCYLTSEQCALHRSSEDSPTPSLLASALGPEQLLLGPHTHPTQPGAQLPPGAVPSHGPPATITCLTQRHAPGHHRTPCPHAPSLCPVLHSASHPWPLRHEASGLCSTLVDLA